MSERGSSVRVEDLLSSVKRLVTDEVSQLSGGKAATPDKLVLTPSLRVNTDAESADTQQDTAVETPLDAPSQPVEDADPQPLPLPLGKPSADTVDTAAAGQPSHAATGFDEAAAKPFFLKRDHMKAASLEATIAELEAAVDAHAEEWEPDGSENEPVFTPTPRMFVRNTSAATPPPSETTEEPLQLRPADMAAQPAPTPEPEGLKAPSLSPFTPPPETADSDADTDDLLLDEDMLREMVAQIVREELQGPLGERITRNVRKLVRREIYRILETETFD